MRTDTTEGLLPVVVLKHLFLGRKLFLLLGLQFLCCDKLIHLLSIRFHMEFSQDF